jgi:hypothetical protein
MLAVLAGRELTEPVGQAVRLLATVLGQDLTEGEDGVVRIARKVAKDRVISTVDPDARHGHKTSARGFDGYKGHIAIDPDTEIITATTATAGNSGDAEVAEELLTDILPAETETEGPAVSAGQAAVYGDAAYGAGELLERLDNADIHNGLKGATSGGGERSLPQRPLRHRPRYPDGDLPRREHRAHPVTGRQTPHRTGIIRCLVRRLPAGRPVHLGHRRPRDHHRP